MRKAYYIFTYSWTWETWILTTGGCERKYFFLKPRSTLNNKVFYSGNKYLEVFLKVAQINICATFGQTFNNY